MGQTLKQHHVYLGKATEYSAGILFFLFVFFFCLFFHSDDTIRKTIASFLFLHYINTKYWGQIQSWWSKMSRYITFAANDVLDMREISFFPTSKMGHIVFFFLFLISSIFILLFTIFCEVLRGSTESINVRNTSQLSSWTGNDHHYILMNLSKRSAIHTLEIPPLFSYS